MKPKFLDKSIDLFDEIDIDPGAGGNAAKPLDLGDVDQPVLI